MVYPYVSFHDVQATYSYLLQAVLAPKLSAGRRVKPDFNPYLHLERIRRGTRGWGAVKIFAFSRVDHDVIGQKVPCVLSNVRVWLFMVYPNSGFHDV